MEKKFWNHQMTGQPQFSEIDHRAIPPLTINSLSCSPMLLLLGKFYNPKFTEIIVDDNLYT
jgi:hypothetical protein